LKVSKTFRRDFARLSSRYGWTPDEAEKIKANIMARPGIMPLYWRNLAAAHQAGYTRTLENNFISLRKWYEQKGRLDPLEGDIGNAESVLTKGDV
jgi:hypothetical protein